MKSVVTSILTLVLIVFLCMALPVSGEEQIYEDVVRLHVLPTSDTAEAQSLKILVRDAILDEYGALLEGSGSAEETVALLTERLLEIEALVAQTVKEAGADARVCVSLGKEEFETRSYGAVTLPRGSYTSLTVTLDEGAGQNWWCVLYPSLCTDLAMGETLGVDESALTDAEQRLVTSSGYMLRFRTLELLKDWFS